MFICTMKYSRRRLLGVLWLLLLAFLGFLLLRSCGSDRTAAAATNEQRVAYLTSLGWQVEPEPVETLSLTLPKELEEPYLSYNVLQRAQGFALEPCCGKTVERCTYTVKNHPSGKVCQADLYICGGEIVAGDILCTGEGGDKGVRTKSWTKQRPQGGSRYIVHIRKESPRPAII